MEYVEISRELISVIVTLDMLEVRMERIVKVSRNILWFTFNFENNAKTVAKLFRFISAK